MTSYTFMQIEPPKRPRHIHLEVSASQPRLHASVNLAQHLPNCVVITSSADQLAIGGAHPFSFLIQNLSTMSEVLISPLVDKLSREKVLG